VLSSTDFFLWPQHNYFMLLLCHVCFRWSDSVTLAFHSVCIFVKIDSLSVQIVLFHSGSLLVLLQMFIYV
jgi:hypothetical protein